MINFRCCFCGFDPAATHIRITVGDEGLSGNVRYVCACGQYLGKQNENEHIREFFDSHATCGVVR